MKKMSSVLLLSTVLLGANLGTKIFADVTEDVSEPVLFEEIENAQDMSATALFEEIYKQGFDSITPKELKDEKVPLLKDMLEKRDWVVARIINALNNVKLAFNKMREYEKKIDGMSMPDERKEKIKDGLAKRLKGLIVLPVSKFLVTIYKYKNWLRPLVEESVVGAGIPLKEALLFDLLGVELEYLRKESKDQKEYEEKVQKELEKFFDEKINTKIKMLQAGCEFGILFADLEESMPVAFEGGQAFLDKVGADNVFSEEHDEDLDED